MPRRRKRDPIRPGTAARPTVRRCLLGVTPGQVVAVALILMHSLLVVTANNDNTVKTLTTSWGRNATNTTSNNFTSAILLDDDGTDFGVTTLEPTAQPTAQPTTTVPTQSPVITKEPTLSPTTTPNDHPRPLQEEVCLPDRFDNTDMDVLDATVNIKRLYPGQLICSKPYSERRYRFGMTLEGHLIWEDTNSDQVIVLYENNDERLLYFELTTDATMLLKEQSSQEDTTVWEGPALHLNNRPMSHHPRCLSNHDCPYLHMHSDGVMVLNWISGGWATRNFVRVYGFDDMADIDCDDTRAC